MKRHVMLHVMLAAVAAAVVAAGGATQGWSAARKHAAAPARPAPAESASGLGEIMSLQQMRHIKLWFAGSAANWELAAYELDELKEGFDDVLKRFPTKDGVALAPLVKLIADHEIPELEKAIAARDAVRFASAFDALTAGCNGCHQSAKHGFIVIQRPASQPYSNQSFAPKSP
jgi:hypothetical protein